MSEEAEAAGQPEGASFPGLPEAIAQEPENTEAAPQQPVRGDASKPVGYDPIDFATATPEEIKARHDYLYRQIKDQKRTQQTLREYKEIAAEQARRIEELTTGFTGVVTHLQDKTFADTESQLMQQMQAAHESGDSAAYIAAQNKLIDLKAEKKIAEQQRKAAPKEAKSAVNASASQVANEAYADGEITYEDTQYVNAWQQERDASGNLLRPWAFNPSPDPNRPDPQYVGALAEYQAISLSPRFVNATMEQKMAELDRRMGTARPQSRQTVMGANLTGGQRSSKIALSSKQQEIAVRTKFGGPKAKSDADHIEAYRKQIEQSRKGARK